jgi:hypothetical protein
MVLENKVAYCYYVGNKILDQTTSTVSRWSCDTLFVGFTVTTLVPLQHQP